MKHFLLGIVTAATLAGILALARTESTASHRNGPETTDLKIETGDRNPWTSLKINTDASQFQFAVVTDRTGGHREKVFSRAVLQVNLLQPQFVMSVGDLIEGYTLNEERIKNEWDEFDSYVKRFEMPFFYVPGNHDLTNKVMVAKWGERYGRRYYHFTYKNTLFLCLCSENPPDMGTIDPEQREWVAKTLEANKDVRWTFVFLHKPIWTARDLQKNGWAAVEQALAGRKYTVFCGHVHRYQTFERNGTTYYQLATTGGGSRLRGVDYGEFDHIAWVTVKKDGPPLIANVLLEGILPADLKLPDTEEKGFPVKRKPTHPVEGKVTLDGQAVSGATVVFHTFVTETEKYAAVCEGRTDELGRFKMTTYARFDGAPVGDYVVTVVKTGKPEVEGEAPQSLLPAKYADPTLSPLRVTVKESSNTVQFELTSN
jgi:Icc-related predicted phosphoesterase